MNFKKFIQLDELVGQYGSIKSVRGPIGIHRALRRIHTQTRKKGPSRVKRFMAAGKCRNPNRPARLTAPNKPMVVPSVLESKNVASSLQNFLAKITKKINDHYNLLSEKYNPTVARLIVGSAIIGSFSPIPGSTFLAALPFIGLGEVINLLKGKPELLDQIQKDYPTEYSELAQDFQKDLE